MALASKEKLLLFSELTCNKNHNNNLFWIQALAMNTETYVSSMKFEDAQ